MYTIAYKSPLPNPGDFDLSVDMINELRNIRDHVQQTDTLSRQLRESHARLNTIVRTIDWLINASPHDVGFGSQLLALIDLSRRPDGESDRSQEASQLLQVFLTVLGINKEVVVRPFTHGRTYSQMVPRDHTRQVLGESARMYNRFFLTPVNNYHTGEAAHFADSSEVSVNYLDFGRERTLRVRVMPLRSAILRAMILAWITNPTHENAETLSQADHHYERRGATDSLERLVTTPHPEMLLRLLFSRARVLATDRTTVRPSSSVLMDVLAEAIDDEVYQMLSQSQSGTLPASQNGINTANIIPPSGIAYETRLSPLGRMLLQWCMELCMAQAEPYARSPLISPLGQDQQQTHTTGSGSSVTTVSVTSPRVVSMDSRTQTIAPSVDRPFDAIIVPVNRLGDANLDAITARVRHARQAYFRGLSQRIVLSGPGIGTQDDLGDVARLCRNGTPSEHDSRLIPEEDIAIDPLARRLSTAIRNASRYLLSQRLFGPYLVVSGADAWEEIPTENEYRAESDRAQGIAMPLIIGGATAMFATTGIISNIVTNQRDSQVAQTNANAARNQVLNRIGIPTPEVQSVSTETSPALPGSTVGGILAGMMGGGALGVWLLDQLARRQVQRRYAEQQRRREANQTPIYSIENTELTSQLSDFWRHFREDYGHPLGLFLGNSQAFVRWARGEASAGFTPLQTALQNSDTPIALRVQQRARSMEALYRSIPQQHHSVFVPTFEVTYRYNLREPGDP